MEHQRVIILFEFFGTMFLTLFQGGMIGVELIIAIWVLTAIGNKISGSHFNPAVTISFMFRKEQGRFERRVGLIYIAA